MISSVNERNLEIETETCMALAGLWDDPVNNNFDCPWDWREARQKRKDEKMALIGSHPASKFEKLLDKFDREGFGYHISILKSAGIFQAMNIPVDQAVDMMHKASEKVSRRGLQSGEIEKAVEWAYNHVVDGKRFVKPTPEVDKESIARYGERGDIEELRSKTCEIPRTAQDILLGLYQEDDLVYIAGEVFNGEAMSVLKWQGMALVEKQFIAPNPLKDEDAGRVLCNIAEDRYIVFESDIPELAGNWDWQAGVIERLASILPLKMICWSGNKSLHAWFVCRGHAESTRHRFKNMAIKLGADPASLRPNQLVRLPWGTRSNKKIQKVIYWHG